MGPVTVLLALLTIAATSLAQKASQIRELADALSTDLSAPDACYILPALLDGATKGAGGNDFDLLDVVLVASVDGRFHALNRTSGQTLWSMSSPSATAAPSGLAPLVRTSHVETDPDTTDDDDAPHQELYIIEPQTGDIYVMASPTSPLQRLPFSMSQLVDMSPYSSSGEDYTRVFVGRKETSLLLIELETGKVKAAVNSECPWDPFEDLAETDVTEESDDPEGSRPPRPTSTEVFIGRIDYHITIHTWPVRASSPKPPAQNLSFSTYGPNNQDLALQAGYLRTPDDAYIQSLPNGEVISFKTRAADSEITSSRDSQLVWGRTFSNPVVAVFDVLKPTGQQQPIVLLQPRARLQDVMPSVDFPAAAKANRLRNLDSAYVGLVEESGSLFAMSPDHFPLVVFGDANAQTWDRLIESSEAVADTRPDLVSEVVGPGGSRERCRNGSSDRRCLTGVRPLEESSRSKLSRLLDGAPTLSLPPGHNANPLNDNLPSPSNGSPIPHWMWSPKVGSRADGRGLIGMDSHVGTFSTAVMFLSATVLGWLWITRKQVKTRELRTHTVMTVPPENVSDISPTLPRHFAEPPPDAKTPENTPSPPTDTPIKSTDHPPNASALHPDQIPAESFHDALEGDDTDKEDPTATPGKRKGIRRKRGKKKKVGFAGGTPEEGEEEQVNENGILLELKVGGKAVDTTPNSVILPSAPQAPTPGPSLIVSDTVLGYGSHGTVVYRGSLQGRAVAVKRLLQDFVTLASREVNVLQESDDHPNVIRYYYQEAHANFLYIALELCPASLADVIEKPDQFRDISVAFDPKRALLQITSGLRHLHALKIIHRDIKPQNILVSSAKQGAGKDGGHRMLISDFGLCKKLDVDQTSFLPTVHGMMASGTVGWRAPEILRGEVQLDEAMAEDHSQSSRGSTGIPTGGSPGSTVGPTRLTKFVDIFALGCLFYYTLTNGSHPFGDRFEREVNILKGAKNLDGLERFGEEGSEGFDLISAMLMPEAYQRPDTTTCLLHPYFWSPARRLSFLQDASDRFEIMCREPRDRNLITLETDAVSIVGNDWHTRLDKVFIENLGKFRKYDGKSVQDLLRAIRNKKHHYQDLPENVKRHLGPMPQGFLSYFTRRFPRLFLHVHEVVASTSLRTEPMFRSYFELPD